MMRHLPLVEAEKIEQQSLKDRINLANRPSFGADSERLDKVASRLASSGFDRERFIADPQSYLREQSVSIPSGQVTVERRLTATSEIISCYMFCTISHSQYVVAVQSYAIATKVYGTSVASNKEPGSGFGYSDIV